MSSALPVALPASELDGFGNDDCSAPLIEPTDFDPVLLRFAPISTSGPVFTREFTASAQLIVESSGKRE